MNFKQFLEYNALKINGSLSSNPNGRGNTVGLHNDGNRDGNTGAFVSTAYSGSESDTEKPFTLPGIDLINNMLPTIKDESKVESIKGDRPEPGSPPKNTIKITLQNGRQILMSHEEFKRAGGRNVIENKKIGWILLPKGNLYQVQSIYKIT